MYRIVLSVYLFLKKIVIYEVFECCALSPIFAIRLMVFREWFSIR